LRADRKPIEIDILRCLAHASLENVDTLKNRGLAADKAQHHALVFDKAERLEVARSLGVVFKQKMIHFCPGEKSFRDGFISAGAKVMTLEVAAAHMHAESYARRRSGDGVVEAFDVEIDKVIRFLPRVLGLLADRGIA
jgi:hypothetical protein